MVASVGHSEVFPLFQASNHVMNTVFLCFSVAACLFLLYVIVSEEDTPAISNSFASRTENKTTTNYESTKKSTKRTTISPLIRMMTSIPPSIKANPKLSAEFLRDYYAKQAEERARWLRMLNLPSQPYDILYNVLVPEVFCPNLVRVGHVVDGGKWMCNPPAMPRGNCSIYSLGLRNEVSFDREIQEFNGNNCSIYGYDQNEPDEATVEAFKSFNGIARRISIQSYTNETMGISTIGDLLRANNDSSLEILKIDVEGTEYKTLPAFLDEFKPCQMFLEMHGRASQMKDLLYEIARWESEDAEKKRFSRDYLLFFYEVNGNNIAACEYSFIYPNCMERYGVMMLAPYLSESVEMTRKKKEDEVKKEEEHGTTQELNEEENDGE